MERVSPPTFVVLRVPWVSLPKLLRILHKIIMVTGRGGLFWGFGRVQIVLYTLLDDFCLRIETYFLLHFVKRDFVDIF